MRPRVNSAPTHLAASQAKSTEMDRTPAAPRSSKVISRWRRSGERWLDSNRGVCRFDLEGVVIDLVDGSAVAQRALHAYRVGRLARQDMKHVVAGKAENIVNVVVFAPFHRFVAAVMTVAAHQDSDLGPMAAFSSRDMVGCEHRGSPLSGAWPTAILKTGSCLSASQSLASS